MRLWTELLRFEVLIGNQLRRRIAFADTQIPLQRRLLAVPLFVQMRAGKRDEAFSAASRTSDPVTLPRDHFAVETGALTTAGYLATHRGG